MKNKELGPEVGLAEAKRRIYGSRKEVRRTLDTCIVRNPGRRKMDRYEYFLRQCALVHADPNRDQASKIKALDAIRRLMAKELK